MKKILLIVSFVTLSLFIGCKGLADKDDYVDTKKQETYEVQSGDLIYKSGFNQENYVWENWQFSTNRVDKK